MGLVCARLCGQPGANPNWVSNFYFQALKTKDPDTESRQSEGSFLRFEMPTRSYENIHSYYILESDAFQKGGFGKVYKAYLKADMTQHYAVKVIPKSDEQMNGIAMREIEMLRKMDHPYIVKFKEVYEDENSFFIVLEHLEGGDLMKLLDAHGPLDELICKELLWQVVLATNYLHAQKIVHGDLKPENFVIVSSGSSRIKMIDFGLSDVMVQSRKLSQFAGSRYYLAPEVLNGSYNEKRDIWSIGVMLYVFLTGKYPFYSNSESELYEKIKAGHFDISPLEQANLSKEVIDLCKNLIVFDPEDRLSAKQVIHHPWFSRVREECHLKGSAVLSAGTLENLRSFSASSWFKQEVIALMAQSFEDKDHIDTVIKLFLMADSDFTGTLNQEEIERIFNFASLNLLPMEVVQIMKCLRFKERGEITFLEFTIGTMHPDFFTNEKRLLAFFNSLDNSRSGMISASDLVRIFARFGRCLPKFKIDAMISEVDINNDRLISFEEFRESMLS